MKLPQNDEEFGQFGMAAVVMLDRLFPNKYKKIIIVSPSFDIRGASNISPQFKGKDFFLLRNVEAALLSSGLLSNPSRFSPSCNVEDLFDDYRYDHIIFANEDMSILTAWAQAEYAMVAFSGARLVENSEWLEEMQAMGVVRQVP